MKTELQLTPLLISDAEGIFQLWSDRDATRLTNWPYFTNYDDSVARLEKCLKYYENPLHFGAYAIRMDGLFVGIAGADVIDEAAAKYDVWYFIDRKKWGQGIAKQALQQLLTIMRDSGRAKTARATAVTENIASWRTLEHHNFVRIGVIPGGHTKQDQNLDLYQYRLDL